MTRRILCADDDPDIRRLVAFTFRRRGYEVIEASSGDVALELTQTECPDLAILDVTMPGLTGLEVVRALRAEPGTAALPIILLSASGQAAEVANGLATGASVYLVKPFAPRELAACVDSLLPAE